MSNPRLFLLLGSTLFLGCGGPTLAERRVESAPAVSALQEGRFDDAQKAADSAIEKSPRTPEALLVRAITRYRNTMTQLAVDGRTIVMGLDAGGINQRYLQATAKQAEEDLAAVDADLAEAQKSKNVSLELCLACWKGIDWTGDGRINQRDELLLQIEVDETGEPLPEGDPRRTPTFRFDDGDIAWARAFVGFERAFLDIVLAYDYSDINHVFRESHGKPRKLVLRLADKGRIAEAKTRLLEALDQSAACRAAYLEETDDDREWVPNPRQKNHPMPLPVDQALYETWDGVLGDLRKLVKGEEGLAVADIADLAKGELKTSGGRGFINIGRMLDHPKDIVIREDDIDILDQENVNLGAFFASFLGEYYVASMKPSALPKRLNRMKGEMDAHQEELEHKLRYLFWLN